MARTQYSLEAICSLLRAGRVVAIPTDTVYGLASYPFDSKSVAEIFALKRRPKEQPLPLLAASVDQVLPYVHDLPPDFEEIASAHWPGALTLVLPARVERVPVAVRAGLTSVAFRVPDHPLTLELLEKMGPLAVTSANHHAFPPATSAEEVEALFGDLPTLDGGKAPLSEASTIWEWTGQEWQVLREGALQPHLLETQVS